MASNNLSVNIISDEELAQKRQDLLTKNTIKRENNAKRKFEVYLKACHIENYEECNNALLSVTRSWTTCR
jgi:hypothetical protein